eukprot:CAMPEP_0113515666 /NCGR_PEP_ID=MMETSP0014_2-20120614/41123_1 /TAXON_ID=2857 /ORGANISM="Nitzschia sp." /LENGTH=31 /DNA_ID=CAMNT_0000412363 /DNA_START=66 /DNA_END=158 /DNA_ORIENTATION=+ /assembly_acc=CAM_ASM_000159
MAIATAVAFAIGLCQERRQRWFLTVATVLSR